MKNIIIINYDYDACGHTCRDDCYGDWVIAWCELPKFEE